MERFIKMVKQEELSGNYDQIEYCGTYDSSLDQYYFVLDKNDFDAIAEAYGAEDDYQREDLRNKIITKQIKDVFLVEADSMQDSLTGYFKEQYGGADGVLMKFGYLNILTDSNDYYEDVTDDGDIDDSSIDEPKVVDTSEDLRSTFYRNSNHSKFEVESLEDAGIEALPRKEKAEPTSVDEKEVLVLTAMIKIITRDLNLNYDSIRKTAEKNVEFTLNPVLSEEDLYNVLDILVSRGIYSAEERQFFIDSYNSGNQRQITAVLESRCKELTD